MGDGALAERGGADLVDRPVRTDPSARPSEIMTAIRIVQYGDPILTTPTTPLDLPREADLVREIVRELRRRADEVQRAHEFRTGMGLAAPQIGVARSVAIFRPHDGPEAVLINPRVVFSDPGEDEWTEDSEGCLSFFDARYLIRRPRFIVVVHQAPDGTRRSSTFERGRHARDVLHEVDHLSGRLCRDLGREAEIP
jgi:peptide deformylase